MKKTVRGYALEPEQRNWLTKKALKATADQQVRVSDSKILRDLITEAMKKEGRKFQK